MKKNGKLLMALNGYGIRNNVDYKIIQVPAENTEFISRKLYNLLINKMPGIAILSILFLSISCAINAQTTIAVPQLEPIVSQGSGIFSMAPPKGHMPPKDQMPAMDKMPAMGPDTANTSSINTQYLGISYGSVSKTQTLDIYLPNEGKGPFPVVIDIHGGAFMVGNSRTHFEGDIINSCVNHGYAVVSINYRLSGEARFPRAVNDVKAAVRFVRANAAKYNFNPNKIVAWGGSAGGNLAAMLGTTGNVDNLNGDNTENLAYSSSVQAVIDWFGPCDFLKYDDQFKASGIHTPFGSVFSPDSPESLYIGKSVNDVPAFAGKANPETYIGKMDTKTAPYFFIEHGSADQNIPTVQSKNLANTLKAQIGADKVSIEILNGARHGDPAFFTPENFTKAFKFLDAVLNLK